MGALNPSCMGLIGENMSENMFSKCKEMTDELEEFTFSTLKKYKKYVKSLARDLLKNETIVYARIKELLPNKLENSLNFKFNTVKKNLKE